MKLSFRTQVGRAMAVIAAMVFVSCLQPAQAPDPGDPDDSVPGPRHLSTFGVYAEIKVGDTLVFDGIRWSGGQMNQFGTDSIVRTILVDSILEEPGPRKISIFYTSRDTRRTYRTGYTTSGPDTPLIWRDSVFMGERDTLFSGVDSFSTDKGDSTVFANYVYGNPADNSLEGIHSYVGGGIYYSASGEPHPPLFRFWNTMKSDSIIIVGSDSVSGWNARESYFTERTNRPYDGWRFVIEKSKGLKYFIYHSPMRYTGGTSWTWKRRDSH